MLKLRLNLPRVTAFVVLGIISFLLGYVPILFDFSFDFAAVLTLPVTLVSAVLAIQTISRIRQSEGSVFSFRMAWISVHGTAAVMAIAPLPAVLVRMLIELPCAPLEGIAYYLMLPTVGAFFGASTGLAAAALTKTPARGYMLFAALVVSSLGYSLWRIAVTPAVYSFNPLFGYFPGPIYDYETGFPPALIISRILLIIAMAPIGILARAYLSSGNLRHRRPQLPGKTAMAISTLGIAVLAVSWFFRFQAGIETSGRFHRSIMNATFETPHFELRYEPGTYTEAAIAWQAAEHEFRYDQLSGFFGKITGHRFNSYLYSSPERKKKLMGAGRTQMIDPLERSLHLNPSEIPHPLLRHELAHLFSLEFGLPVIGISISPGLLEGVAVAADWPEGSRRPHSMAASLLAREIQLDAVDFIDPLRFWTGSGTKTYNLAGSFVRFLVDRYGMQPFRDAYPTASFESTYNKPLSELNDEWLSFLTTVPLDSLDISRNAERMQQPSIFVERNIRFKAGKIARARRLLESDRTDEALDLCDDVLSRYPGYLPAVKLSVGILADRNETAVASALLEKNRELFLSTTAGRFYYLRERGELHQAMNEPLRARKCFTELVLSGGAASRSAAHGYVRLYCLDLAEPERRAAFRLLRNPGDNDALTLIRDSCAKEMPGWLLPYLAGRALMHKGSFSASIEYLASAESACTSCDAVKLESQFYLGKALFLSGRFSDAEQTFSRLHWEDTAGTFDSDDWIERCLWYNANTRIEGTCPDLYPALKELP